MSYTLTARVVHYTTAKLVAPRTVHSRSRITFTGKITGADSGRVLIELRVGRSWVKVAAVSVKKNGTFRVLTSSGAPGKYRYRAVYSGNARHLPSGATTTLTVVK